MTHRVLVTYATKHGSTREVAETVGEVLRGRGIEVDVRPVAAAGELEGYDGVVLGTALYTGRPLAEARRFLKRHREALAARAFAVFGMGPLTIEAKDVEGSRAQLDRALARTPELEPAAVAIFGGVVKPEELAFPFTRMKASDARDWGAIHDWAEEVADQVLHRRVAIAAAP